MSDSAMSGRTARTIRLVQETLLASEKGLTRSKLASLSGLSYAYVTKLLRENPTYFLYVADGYNDLVRANADNMIDAPLMSIPNVVAEANSTSGYNYHEDFDAITNALERLVEVTEKRISGESVTGQHNDRPRNACYVKLEENYDKAMAKAKPEDIAKMTGNVVKVLAVGSSVGNNKVTTMMYQDLYVVKVFIEGLLDEFGDANYKHSDKLEYDEQYVKEVLNTYRAGLNANNAG